MHILVLSAFRRRKPLSARSGCGMRSQCTFWCSVLSDGIHRTMNNPSSRSQCTFWRSVLSDTRRVFVCHPHILVSMHLLVLSAFRHKLLRVWAVVNGLNAPFGAQCFPTAQTRKVKQMASSLNAPFGAQCFPTGNQCSGAWRVWSQCTFWCSVLSDLALVPQHSVGEAVSMHLLVLSAFRLGKGRHRTQRVGLSQCTFWCSVLSDGPKMFIRDCGVFPSLNAPFGAQCFPTEERKT